MAYDTYVNMRRKDRRLLLERARKGNPRAISAIKQYAREVKTEVNKRLRELERKHYDYGPVYDQLIYYLQVEHNSVRMKSNTKLKMDIDEIWAQMEHGVKFLANKASKWEVAKEREEFRIEKLIEHDTLPKEFRNDMKQHKDFLRFLGSEEMTAAIDEYGASDRVVEMVWDAYKKQGNALFPVLSKALDEFLDKTNNQEITFDMAMRRAGINIEDYYNRRFSG